MKDALLDLTSQLIECPSITPNDANCQTIITTRLTALGFQCEALPVGKVSNLWARLGKNAPLLVFAGHTDVVPPGPLAAWQSPPFTATLRDGYLYGRGATDMKGALAAKIIAVAQFLKTHGDFKGSLAFLITSDEEGSALDGTQQVLKILAARNERIDYCLIGEASSEKTVGDQLRIGRRGSLHGKLTINGKQGHVAHPHLADNPIHRAMLALHEFAYTTWDEGNAHFPETSLQITNINSGTGATNVIPASLTVLFNFRFGTASSIDELQAKVAALLQRFNLQYTLEWEIGGLPFLSTPGKLLAAVNAAILARLNRLPQLSTGGGTSDGRFIAPTGAEVVELGVIHATAHQVNECVKMDELLVLSELYTAILQNIFS